ncbi:DUF2547 family protein [Caenorhabditis elegans]|uniref:DUF2547 family protein n=1 Tax=Caenorhabditis elegans TaxID=6239 RepID=Q9N4P0_CAEEL|nr:DUF2547 family protein [Caenorhabditis elegans]CCD73705.1 DUF2547 family protein [Caenorhabditis elegans]|eukprot:NP_494401.1 Uncharacterized protein CELE_ZK355.3 [Caenorhabditis elegans]
MSTPLPFYIRLLPPLPGTRPAPKLINFPVLLIVKLNQICQKQKYLRTKTIFIDNLIRSSLKKELWMFLVLSVSLTYLPSPSQPAAQISAQPKPGPDFQAFWSCPYTNYFFLFQVMDSQGSKSSNNQVATFADHQVQAHCDSSSVRQVEVKITHETATYKSGLQKEKETHSVTVKKK